MRIEKAISTEISRMLGIVSDRQRVNISTNGKRTTCNKRTKSSHSCDDGCYYTFFVPFFSDSLNNISSVVGDIYHLFNTSSIDAIAVCDGQSH